VTVEDRSFFPPLSTIDLVRAAHAEEVRDDFRGAVVVPVDPDHFHFVRDLANLGQDFPVVLLSRRKSMESKTSPLRMSCFACRFPLRTPVEEMKRYFAWQFSLPRWMSENHDGIEHGDPRTGTGSSTFFLADLQIYFM